MTTPAATLLVGTRKGLFTLERAGSRWEVGDVAFLGEPVTAVVAAPDGTTLVALGTGHFGSHIWRREPEGAWAEVGAPAYPPRPDDATVAQLWERARTEADA